MGTGLEEETLAKYKVEWDMYVRFCIRRGWKKVPGRDRKWSIQTIAPYLRWRARNNNARTIAQIKSKLKHCGICYDYLLPTAKGEAPAKLRLQLAMVTKDISKRERSRKKKAGLPTGPRRALALGRVAISLLFSAYAATTEKSFMTLPRRVRHYLVICACMHTACMRFKLIRELHKDGYMRWSQPSKAYVTTSDWNKMKRQVGHYTVKFPKLPRYEAMVYHSYGRAGEVISIFTAADVLRWHVQAVGSSEGRNIFAPTPGRIPKPKMFTQWLRESFRVLLVGKQSEIDALVRTITPHSFRAGMATDLERSDVHRSIIMKLGRWASARAMEQYIRDGLAQRLSNLRYHSIARSKQKVKRTSAKVTSVKTRLDESEGYEDSPEDTDEDYIRVSRKR